jgi:hypothetical protein
MRARPLLASGKQRRLNRVARNEAMANVTYYVALPFMRDESGEMIAGNAE